MSSPPRTDQDKLKRVIAPRSKRGASVFAARKSRKCTDLETLTKPELYFARAYSASLKAVGYSWRYISDTLNIQTGLVKAWADDPEWQAMAVKVADDIVSGAVDHLQRHALELTEMLLELARSTLDDKVRLQAIEAGLDRVGVSKVNKSESIVTKNVAHEHAMSEEFFSQIEALPIETQTKLAEMSAEMEQLVIDSKGTG